MKKIVKLVIRVNIYLSIMILNVYAQQSFSGCQVCNGSSINNARWELIGTKSEPDSIGLGEGIVQKICVDKHDPSGNTLYAGSRLGGLWKSINGGQSWKCITDTLRLPDLGINCIAIHPDSSNVIYISATDNNVSYTNPEFGVGILKSIDGGVTWHSTSLISDFKNNKLITTRAVFISPNKVNGIRPVFAFTYNELYRSMNYGQTFSLVYTLNSPKFGSLILIPSYLLKHRYKQLV